MNERLPPVSRKKSRLDPIAQDVFRRSQTGFGLNDGSKVMQIITEENEKLKRELEKARKEIFMLKEENVELKKQSKGAPPKGKTTFVTSTSGKSENGVSEEVKLDNNEVL